MCTNAKAFITIISKTRLIDTLGVSSADCAGKEEFYGSNRSKSQKDIQNRTDESGRLDNH